MERDCESELSKLNIEQNACIYHFGASVIHGQRSNILRLRKSLHISSFIFIFSLVFCNSTPLLDNGGLLFARKLAQLPE